MIEQEKEVKEAMKEIANKVQRQRKKPNASYIVESVNHKEFPKQVKEQEM